MRIQRRLLLGIGITAVSATALGYAATRIIPVDHVFKTASAGTAQNPLARPVAAATRYVCPMHAEVVQDHPGSCPICGMHLVKAGSGGTTKHSDLVHVDMQTQHRMGVQMQTVAVNDMHRAINTFATISPDESRTVSVNSKVEGWIRRWHIQGVGQQVRKGQVLYEIYSPELQQRQREYVDLLTRRDAMQEKSRDMDMLGPNAAMMGSLAKERFRTRDRLLAADIPPEELELLEKGRRVPEVMPIRATQSGIVTAISAREGSYINPMQTLMVYSDNSRVWAEVTLFPDQISWLRNGDEIVLTSGLDNTVQHTARINLATLQIDPASRTAKLRLPLSKAGEAFLPGAYAKATIKSAAHRAVSVPRDAVIRTGHGEFVVVSEGDGHFRSAAVAIGLEDERMVEIRSGLKAGDRIAVNGQFLLDAASSMHAMQNRLSAAPAEIEPVADIKMAKAIPAMEICSTTPKTSHAHAHP
ncbi:Putative heavy metal efflux system protein [Herminiimonas arsenicoxydans]|uniref:Heavy metal efflux system protein n=1 Tax=Herminiimonas arsenicoxydans TaxID=204773 RepID=A4GA14_HERAR|nr:Putative heavy metal efflux system protein [Herminiimonas arsenicoxydans]